MEKSPENLYLLEMNYPLFSWVIWIIDAFTTLFESLVVKRMSFFLSSARRWSTWDFLCSPLEKSGFADSWNWYCFSSMGIASIAGLIRLNFKHGRRWGSNCFGHTLRSGPKHGHCHFTLAGLIWQYMAIPFSRRFYILTIQPLDSLFWGFP